MVDESTSGDGLRPSSILHQVRFYEAENIQSRSTRSLKGFSDLAFTGEGANSRTYGVARSEELVDAVNGHEARAACN